MQDLNLQRALELIDSATREMTAEQLAWHPEGKWSTATILEHLSMTFYATAKGMRRTFDAGRIECRRSTPKELLFQLVTVGLGYFPEGRKAPPQATPSGALPGPDAMREIRENLASMDAAISNCAEKFGRKQKILVHPILGPLSLAQWTKFHYVHTRHHMKQVRERRSAGTGRHSAVGAQ